MQRVLTCSRALGQVPWAWPSGTQSLSIGRLLDSWTLMVVEGPYDPSRGTFCLRTVSWLWDEEESLELLPLLPGLHWVTGCRGLPILGLWASVYNCATGPGRAEAGVPSSPASPWFSEHGLWTTSLRVTFGGC